MNFIDGIALSNYRSFGFDIQKIGPFSKINLFIGKNNSGKSNILRFIYHYLKHLNTYINWNGKSNFEFQASDIHLGLSKANIKFGLGYNCGDIQIRTDFITQLRSKNVDNRYIKDMEKILDSHIKLSDGMVWAILEGTPPKFSPNI